MGSVKKPRRQFVDRRNSATFRLMPSAAGDASDRVFVRVDSNPYFVPGFLPHHDEEEHDFDSHVDAAAAAGAASRPLPEHVRREILELGLPDDGYDYLSHLREIRPAGAGAAYFPNPRARLDDVPLDVKAYDASRLRIREEEKEEEEEEGGRLVYKVAEKARVVREVEKAVDPDVVRLLDEGDLSRCGSDVEDLEEDFVIQANRPEGSEAEEVEDRIEKVGLELVETERENGVFSDADEEEEDDGARVRVRRPLDEQFDLVRF